MTRTVAGCLLAATALVAFALRALGLERVFPGDGSVVFALGDAFYHARRALFSFEHFPRVMGFDPYLNFPTGTFPPWPPLWTLSLAGVARLFGSSRSVFEHVAAWLPAAVGALTVWPVYAAGRRVGGRGVAIAAAALFAVFPASIVYSNVGNIDHHAAQALIGAIVLALSLAIVSTAPEDEARLGRHFVALTLARAALLLTWPGSVVYLAVTEGCLLLTGVLSARERLLRLEAASAFASAVLVLPVVLVSSTPVGGPFSSIELSRLHLVLLVGVALVCLGVNALERWRPASSPLLRLVRAGAIGAPALLILLAGTGALHELGLGFDYVAKTDAYEGRNLEQYPLFSFEGGFSDTVARRSLGFFAYLVPVAPLVALFGARTGPQHAPRLVLAAWSGVFGALALLQVRFANDYAPAGSVVFALLLGALAMQLARWLPPRAAHAVTLLLCVTLLTPVLLAHARAFPPTLRALDGTATGPDRALLTYQGTMLRFAERVREATPDTAGFDDPSLAPEYGILAYPGIGHVLHYVAQRATPADNFGPYIGLDNFTAVGSFFGLRDEAEAIREAERLKTRYVVTTDYGGPVPWTLVNRLHRGDGSALEDDPAYGRFRLVTEGPAGGRAIGEQFGRSVRSEAVPYKLFEIVPGAELEVQGAPGMNVAAEVLVRTPTRREFTWRTAATVGEDGTARLRVPYATQTTLPARPARPYRVTVGDTAHAVTVSEEAVRTGAVIPVGETRP